MNDPDETCPGCGRLSDGGQTCEGCEQVAQAGVVWIDPCEEGGDS